MTTARSHKETYLSEVVDELGGYEFFIIRTKDQLRGVCRCAKIDNHDPEGLRLVIYFHKFEGREKVGMDNKESIWRSAKKLSFHLFISKPQIVNKHSSDGSMWFRVKKGFLVRIYPPGHRMNSNK